MYEIFKQQTSMKSTTASRRRSQTAQAGVGAHVLRTRRPKSSSFSPAVARGRQEEFWMSRTTSLRMDCQTSALHTGPAGSSIRQRRRYDLGGILDGFRRRRCTAQGAQEDFTGFPEGVTTSSQN